RWNFCARFTFDAPRMTTATADRGTPAESAANSTAPGTSGVLYISDCSLIYQAVSTVFDGRLRGAGLAVELGPPYTGSHGWAQDDFRRRSARHCPPAFPRARARRDDATDRRGRRHFGSSALPAFRQQGRPLLRSHASESAGRRRTARTRGPAGRRALVPAR